MAKSFGQCDGNLDDVVVDDHDGEEDQEDEGGLVDAFFDVQADVAAHQAFDEEQEDYAAVHDGDGQEVEDAEVEADARR